MDTLSIGKLANQCDVSVEAIRYYEREGLLETPSRSASGYRQYAESAVKRLRFIRRAKTLGFTLGEIRNLLAISDHKETGKSEVKNLTEQKLLVIKERIADLQRVYEALSDLSDQCSGEGCIDTCPIIEALNSEATDIH
ncbi:MAG: MerR family DNA-binding protein [Gammaproteobacteria bacterium]|nr:MerR family DNA-binding protein [Gammaproteobacteria bacterium]